MHIVNEHKKLLFSPFEMKEMGEADVILGIRTKKKTNDGFSLCLSHYIEKVLTTFNYFDVLLVRTPITLAYILKKK